MSESVEQAATAEGWRARANREAAAMLDGHGYPSGVVYDRNELVSLLAVAWLQGVNYGSHETLASAEQAFDRLRESL